MTPPCKGCDMRVPGCHARCARYKAYDFKRWRALEEMRKEAAMRSAVIQGQNRVKRSREQIRKQEKRED